MKSVLLITTFLIAVAFSACDKKNEDKGSDETAFENMDMALNKMSEYDNLLAHTTHTDSIHHYDSIYHHYDSLYTQHHDNYHRGDVTHPAQSPHNNHQTVDSIHVVHAAHHPAGHEQEDHTAMQGMNDALHHMENYNDSLLHPSSVHHAQALDSVYHHFEVEFHNHHIVYHHGDTTHHHQNFQHTAHDHLHSINRAHLSVHP